MIKPNMKLSNNTTVSYYSLVVAIAKRAREIALSCPEQVTDTYIRADQRSLRRHNHNGLYFRVRKLNM